MPVKHVGAETVADLMKKEVSGDETFLTIFFLIKLKITS